MNEEKEITISEIWRRIWSQKRLFLAATVAVTLALALALQFGWNGTGRKEYVVRFSLNLPDDGQTAERKEIGYRYPDGSMFYFADYASEGTLAAVKDSDPAFASLNIAKLSDREAISFEEVYTAAGVGNDSPVRRTFEIRADRRYFASETQARAFLTALAEYPVARQRAVTTDENIYLRADDYRGALTFEDQIDYLRKEIEYLSGRYFALAAISGSDPPGSSAEKQSFDAWAQRQDLDGLLAEARARNYLKDHETSVGKYENDLKELENRIEDKEAVLRGITDVVPGAGAMSSDNLAGVVRDLETEIADLKRQQTTLNARIKAYYPSYAEGNRGAPDESHVQATAAFAAKIDAVYDGLVGADGYIARYEDRRSKVYSDLSTVTYSSARVVTKDDAHSIGLPIALVASLLVGVLIGGAVAFLAGTARLRAVAAVKDVELSESDAPPASALSENGAAEEEKSE